MARTRSPAVEELQQDPEATGRIAALIAIGASISALAEAILAEHRPAKLAVSAAVSVAAYTARLALTDIPSPPASLAPLARPRAGFQTRSEAKAAFVARAGYARELLNRARYVRAAFIRGIEAYRSGAGGGQRWRHLERVYHHAHVEAMRSREAARQSADAVGREHGPIVSWNGIKDASTTLDCLEMFGKNIDLRSPPARGIAGTVHGKCRCWHGPPIPGTEVVY